MWRLRQRRADQAGRIETAKASVEQAKAETTRSEVRLEHARDTFINPMWQAGQHNQFTQLIRKTLVDGNGGEQA
jgi:hypothetical protein